jgi:Hemerythrin HHE cation binding domain
MFEEVPETAQGQAIFEELLWVHSVIRRDLDAVRALAVAVADGLPARELQAEIARLQTNGPLWQLKVNCLQYCRFVHLHHHTEDRHFFPLLRRANPGLNEVVDKLEADHRSVSDLLDEVEAAAAALDGAETVDGRARVVDGLDALAVQLLEHLEYEERSAGPTIRRLLGLF